MKNVQDAQTEPLRQGMKSVCLVPYCPWPADTGTKVEMMKHLEALKALGSCTIASARGKPVGFGWSAEAEAELRARGYQIVFREDMEYFSLPGVLGCAYAVVCKAMRWERAFGHANPYHRYAFSAAWIRKITQGADLFVMQYGFWVRHATVCPRAVAVHELLSNYHWGGTRRESRELAMADLVLVVGHDEKVAMEQRGCQNVIWSPPAVAGQTLPMNETVGLVGTKAPQNLEGLRWLEGGHAPNGLSIKVFGNLAGEAKVPFLEPIGRYGANTEPYERCGIHLMTRPDRPGLQIKVVEALAFGRAIVARRGSMRGLPPGEGAWIDVETADEMLNAAAELQGNAAKREMLASNARAFYDAHLSSDPVMERLRRAYASAAGRRSNETSIAR